MASFWFNVGGGMYEIDGDRFPNLVRELLNDESLLYAKDPYRKVAQVVKDYLNEQVASYNERAFIHDMTSKGLMSKGMSKQKY